MSDTKNYSDVPLDNPEDDKLNFAPYAKTLAKAITNVSLNNGAVMAIYGEWGSGKSTLINFILKYLPTETKDNPKQNITVIEFNPWLFSGQENLVAHFFDELQSKLSNKFGQISQKLKSYSSKVSDVVVYSEIPVVSPTLKFLGGIIGRKTPTIMDLKKQIIESLRDSDSRFLIVIDDIDRLTNDEIRQLFSLVKSVANFPNIIYLLAFDKEVVSQAMSPEGYGDAFLEKIVQFPFEMPLVNDEIEDLFLGGIKDIFGKIPHGFREYFTSYDYWTYLRYLIETPRDVFRFINTLRFTYASVEGEVNIADFIAIEMLRMFHESCYNIIRNKSYFIPSLSQFSPTIQDQMVQNEDNADARKNMESFVKLLFPNHQSPQKLAQDLRVSSPDNFDTYFRYSVAPELPLV